MSKVEFILKGEHIPLIGLLKLTGLAATGGIAGMMVTDGEVHVNGEVETRKRKKLIQGDVIQWDDQTIVIK